MCITKDSTAKPVNGGGTTRGDATSAGAVTLPDRPNLTELTNVVWRGTSRSFYISFDNPADQKQFILTIDNNVKVLAEGEYIVKCRYSRMLLHTCQQQPLICTTSFLFAVVAEIAFMYFFGFRGCSFRRFLKNFSAMFLSRRTPRPSLNNECRLRNSLLECRVS